MTPIPDKQCDIVMKGGITSGVVYPRTILKLKDHYRFRNIGGTSAGAIAAAITAAAELDRINGGFERINALNSDLGAHLADLFQPSPAMARLYRVVFGSSKGGIFGATWRALAAYWPMVLCVLIVAAMLAFTATAHGSLAWLSVLIFIFIMAPGTASAIGLAVAHDLRKRLPAADFGMCPGKSQPGSSHPALSDWIATAIETVAGRPLPGSSTFSPLTFGELEKGKGGAGIHLRMMTTDLSLGLGHELPRLRDNNYYWTEAEFRKLFPDTLVTWLMETCRRYSSFDPESRVSGGVLYPFPNRHDLPVAVAVRMSLSFPFLIAAVPLYRKNFASADSGPPVRVLFSDGGISSNFPIHLFDNLLPSRPTFGISLNRYLPEQGRYRVYLPVSPKKGRWMLINSYQSLTDFMWALLDTAKSWQETKQAVLNGYRERIVRIYLKDSEGGLNIGMSDGDIENLGDFGERAGALLSGEPIAPVQVGQSGEDNSTKPDFEPFDFDQHRWRRFLVTYQNFERTLLEMSQRWNDDAGGIRQDIERLAAKPPSFAGKPAIRQEMLDRFGALMQFSAKTFADPLQKKSATNFPVPEATLRIVAEDGRVPPIEIPAKSRSAPPRSGGKAAKPAARRKRRTS